MLVEKQAVCPFCGKQRFVNVESTISESELADIAKSICDCSEAREERGMKLTEEAIVALLGDESKSKGFDYEVDDQTVECIRGICEAILGGLMDKVSLIEPNGDTIKLVRNGNAVKIQRTCKKQVAI